MTEQEIQDVRAAWEADENCRPIGGDAEWLELALELSRNLGASSTAAADVERGLHRRLLALGAWVAEHASGEYAACRVPASLDAGPHELVAVDKSVISCMARAIVAIKGGTKVADQPNEQWMSKQQALIQAVDNVRVARLHI